MYAQIAQSVEQRTENPRVAGSIPALGIFLFHRKLRSYEIKRSARAQNVRWTFALRRPEWNEDALRRYGKRR